MKVKKEWKPDGYIKSALRRIWRWSDKRKSCLRAQRCCQCNSKRKLFADHINPVIDPAKGFQDWNTYIDRMFNGELQALCEKCHKIKSKEENRLRRQFKRKPHD